MGSNRVNLARSIYSSLCDFYAHSRHLSELYKDVGELSLSRFFEARCFDKPAYNRSLGAGKFKRTGGTYSVGDVSLVFMMVGMGVDAVAKKRGQNAIRNLNSFYLEKRFTDTKRNTIREHLSGAGEASAKFMLALAEFRDGGHSATDWMDGLGDGKMKSEADAAYFRAKLVQFASYAKRIDSLMGSMQPA